MLFRRRAFFSFKRKKKILFCVPAKRESTSGSLVLSAFGGLQAGKNSFPPHPLFFLPVCLGFALKNFGRQKRIIYKPVS
jgi:hypothetical protein